MDALFIGCWNNGNCFPFIFSVIRRLSLLQIFLHNADIFIWRRGYNVNCAKRHKQHTSLFWFGRCSVLAVLLTHPSLHRSDESSRKEQDVQEGVYPKHTASCSEHQRGLCRAPLWQHLSDRPRGGLGTTALDTLERDISDCARKDSAWSWKKHWQNSF